MNLFIIMNKYLTMILFLFLLNFQINFSLILRTKADQRIMSQCISKV